MSGVFVEFVGSLPPDGRKLNSGRNPNSHQNWQKAVLVPSEKQPNRGLTDDDPEFTCSVCRETLPIAEAHRVKTKEGTYRRTGRCVECAKKKQKLANDKQAAKRRGPDYVLPVIKDQSAPIVAGQRKCWCCEETKSIEDFYEEKTVASGYQSICIPCFLIRKRAAHLLRTYNITQAKYDEMLAAQDGVCAICGEPEIAVRRSMRDSVLSVDHDHACCPGLKSCGDCVRGLICHSCNVMLGYARDSADRLQAGIAYLALHARG